MRLRQLGDLLATCRKMKAPLRYWRARHRRDGAADLDVQLRDGTTARLRGGTRDAHVFHRVLVQDEYRLDELDLRDAWVVDVGAHVGFFALKAAAKGARVVSVEPAPDNLEPLRRHVEVNRVDGRVRILPVALGAAPGKVTLRREGDPYAYAVAPRGTSGKSSPARGGIDVESSTLATLFEQQGVDRCSLLKLDCEGSEYEILESAPKSVLARCDRIRLEFHFAPGQEAAPQSLRRHLESAGFRIEAYSIKRNGKQGYLFCSRGTGSA